MGLLQWSTPVSSIMIILGWSIKLTDQLRSNHDRDDRSQSALHASSGGWTFRLIVFYHEEFIVFFSHGKSFLTCTEYQTFWQGTPLWVQPVVPKASNTTTLKMPKSHVAFRHWLKWLYSVRREKVSENFLSPKSFSIRGRYSSLSFPSLSLTLLSLSNPLFPAILRRAAVSEATTESCDGERRRGAPSGFSA